MSVLVNSDVREGLSVRKTPLVIYSPLRHLVLRAFPMKISWLQARACAPQTAAALAVQVPLLSRPSIMFLSSVFFPPVICQRQKGLEFFVVTWDLPYHFYSASATNSGWCAQEQRRGFRLTLRLSVAVPSEARDMMLQSGLRAIQGAKTNTTPTK